MATHWNPQEAEQQFRSRVRADRYLVGRAKDHLMGSSRLADWRGAVTSAEEFAGAEGFPRETVVLHPTFDSEAQVARAAEFINRQLAGARAIGELVAAALLETNGSNDQHEPNVAYTTMHGNSGGIASGWRLPDWSFSVPNQIRRPRFVESDEFISLADSTLYAHSAGLANAHSEVVEAVEDGIRCLRVGLYRPAVVMLGKAMEGAWRELGLTLADLHPDVTKGSKLRELVDSERGLRSLIQRVTDAMSAPHAVAASKATKVRAQDLAAVAVWSDVLQQSRNAVHVGVVPDVPNTYEKVAVLYVAGATYFEALYRLRDAIERGKLDT